MFLYERIYLFLYAPKCFLYLSYILPDDDPGWRVRRFKLMNVCYSPSLFREALLRWLRSLPAFLCLILSSDWWLPATLTCPLLPAQIPLSVQETRNILSETLPGCVCCLEIFKMSALFSHDSDMVAPRRKVHPSAALPEGDQSFVSQTRGSMQPAL